MAFLKCISYFLLVAHLCCEVENKYVTVQTNLGSVRGSRVQNLEKNVDVFLGVPFAKPPVGSRRFKRPEPIEAWEGTLDALNDPKACSQPPIPGAMDTFSTEIYKWDLGSEVDVSEDCLYLNVFKPAGVTNAAVLIWIHGGGFSFGAISGPLYDAKLATARENVIVVSVQYRLGFFGFLYLGDNEAPGNMGLVDQHLAIKWVHDNIAEFGGDKNRITIYGESAGACSVILHSLSVQPRYYSRVISQSAASLKWGALSSEDALNLSKGLIEQLGCSTEEKDTREIIDCLATLNNTYISNKFGSAMQGMPSIDGYFLTSPLEEKYSQLQGLNIIIGTNENEGYFLTPQGGKAFMNAETTAPTVDFEQYKETLQNAMLMNESDAEDFKEVTELYQNDDLDYFDSLDGIFGDSWFTCPSNEAADNYVKSGLNSVYMYRLMRKSGACGFPEWMKVSHGCDIDFVFGHPLGPSKLYKEEDRTLSERILKYWANFAKTGNPNHDEDGKSSPGLAAWPAYTTEDHKYLVLDSPSLSVASNLNKDKCDWWKRTGRFPMPSFPTEEPKEEDTPSAEDTGDEKQEL